MCLFCTLGQIRLGFMGAGKNRWFIVSWRKKTNSFPHILIQFILNRDRGAGGFSACCELLGEITIYFPNMMYIHIKVMISIYLMVGSNLGPTLLHNSRRLKCIKFRTITGGMQWSKIGIMHSYNFQSNVVQSKVWLFECIPIK